MTIYKSVFKCFSALFFSFFFVFQAIAAPSYDFFKDSAERIDEAAAILKKSPTDAANVVLFLENLRDSYYTHLDRIEAALPYWEWAKHHPYRYTASQFPHKWFTHTQNQAEIEKIHAMINAVREVYSKEFGIIVRLLAMRQEDVLDDVTWLAEVKKSAATILMTPLEELTTTELIIQKLSDHEKDVAKMVERVQSPNWLKRHWRSLLTTAVVAAAATYYYANNQQMVHDGFIASQKSMEQFWKTAIVKRFLELKTTVEKTMKPIKQVEKPAKTPEVNSIEANIKKSDEALNALEKTSENSFSYPGWNWLKPFAKGIVNYLRTWNETAKSIAVKADKTVDEGGQAVTVLNENLQSNQINFALAAMTPACFLAYGAYRVVASSYNWLTKRDRTTLINRLRQVQQVLIRTTHTTELSDTEYGRLLYLLTKTHDQVIKNVPSNERIAFLNDLTYIANAQSSIKQKRKTLKTMWNSYRSLQQVT